MIIDYAWYRPTIADLKKADVTTVARYIGQDNTGKNLTVPEVKELNNAGIDIITAFEYGAAQATGGRTQGLTDGHLARDQTHVLGQPPGTPVYFACDFNAPDYAPNSSDPKAKLGPIADYFEAIGSIWSLSRIGVYGDYYVCKRLWEAKLVKWTWQTLAWSGGQVFSRYDLLQKGTTFNGLADIDIHLKGQENVGQWISQLVKPPPPVPTAEIGITTGIKEVKYSLELGKPKKIDNGDSVTLLQIHQ